MIQHGREVLRNYLHALEKLNEAQQHLLIARTHVKDAVDCGDLRAEAYYMLPEGMVFVASPDQDAGPAITLVDRPIINFTN